ncbi:transcription initiation factor TFIID subunit 4-like [Chrysemys picta bellii]|uniref:transcription initiation factor TFIID subunit 4-like n=1 Tax=Chrysemys picta bellii TaxID=8478 RepID=UPI0032B17D1A
MGTPSAFNEGVSMLQNLRGSKWRNRAESLKCNIKMFQMESSVSSTSMPGCRHHHSKHVLGAALSKGRHSGPLFFFFLGAAKSQEPALVGALPLESQSIIPWSRAWAVAARGDPGVCEEPGREGSGARDAERKEVSCCCHCCCSESPQDGAAFPRPSGLCRALPGWAGGADPGLCADGVSGWAARAARELSPPAPGPSPLHTRLSPALLAPGPHSARGGERQSPAPSGAAGDTASLGVPYGSDTWGSVTVLSALPARGWGSSCQHLPLSALAPPIPLTASSLVPPPPCSFAKPLPLVLSLHLYLSPCTLPQPFPPTSPPSPAPLLPQPS